MVSGIGSPSLVPYEPTLERAPAPTGDGTNATTTLVAANAHREASGDLTIKTLEGDTVTLSAHLESDATFASIRTRGAQASYLSLERSASFELTVQGDLSEQELKDIEKLVKQFGHELRQFFRGSEGASAADVGRGDFSTLAGFAAGFEASASLTVVAGQATLAPPEPALSGDPYLGPAQPAPVTEEDAAAPETATANLAPDFTALQALVGRLQKLVSTAPMGPEKALRSLGKLLDRIEDALGDDDSRRHVLDHVRRETTAKRHGEDMLGPAREAEAGD